MYLDVASHQASAPGRLGLMSIHVCALVWILCSVHFVDRVAVMQAAICEVQTLALVLAGARVGAYGGIPYAPQCSKTGAKEKYETGGQQLPYCTLLHASCVSASSLTPPVLLMHQTLEI
jgi:hypothetical protein